MVGDEQRYRGHEKVLSGQVSRVFNTRKSDSRNATSLCEVSGRSQEGNPSEEVGRDRGRGKSSYFWTALCESSLVDKVEKLPLIYAFLRRLFSKPSLSTSSYQARY